MCPLDQTKPAFSSRCKPLCWPKPCIYCEDMRWYWFSYTIQNAACVAWVRFSFSARQVCIFFFSEALAFIKKKERKKSSSGQSDHGLTLYVLSLCCRNGSFSAPLHNTQIIQQAGDLDLFALHAEWSMMLLYTLHAIFCMQLHVAHFLLKTGLVCFAICMKNISSYSLNRPIDC